MNLNAKIARKMRARIMYPIRRNRRNPRTMMIKAITIPLVAFLVWWNGLSELERYEAPIEAKAASIGMTTEEFILISSVVEAESDRGSDADSYQGRILIAEVIINRAYESDSFPDTITGVCNQSGQFEVVSNGSVVADRTNISDAAVIEAYEEWQAGDAPMVMYFNNSGYNYGTAYGYYGGNYFVTVP